MSAAAISIDRLSKQYFIGGKERGRNTFREAIVDAFLSPLRGLARHRGGLQEEPQSFWALDNVSLDIAAGDVVGVIGRNGAGKSTLLKILSRITEPTRGRVEVRGRMASLLEVGTGFHPELTGRENIRLNGAILGMTSAEIARKFDEIVSFAGVEKFIDTPVKRYSSGMQTRLAFAVAAHLDPEIMVVDEVLAVGDAEFQKKCVGKMGDIANRGGRTVLFVSHNLGLIRQICRTGVYLERGRVKLAGGIEEAANLYTRDLLDARGTSGNAATLSTDLDLVDVAVADGTHRSFSPARFKLEVRARVSTHILDLAILIERENGERAATIDCRHHGFQRKLAPGETLRVEGEVRSLDLVEGLYKLSVYHRTMSTIGITRDSADLIVSEPPSGSEFTPYWPETRGSLALRVRFDATGEEIIS